MTTRIAGNARQLATGLLALTAVGGGAYLLLGGGGSQDPARCVGVPSVLVNSIESSLTVSGGGSLGTAAAVRSDDFSRAFFVATEIRGPGMSDTVGIWATNDLGEDGMHGLLFSVNGAAKSFSSLPDGGQTQAEFSIADDGARESEDCLDF